MSKKPNMRWRKSDLAEIEKVIKNFNAKLTRVEKKGMDMSYQPERLSTKEVKNKIKTRADYNRFVSSARAYSKRGAEAPMKTSRGAKVTKWAADVYEQYNKERNKKREKTAKEIGKQPVTSRGKKTGNTRAEMGTVKENAVKPSTKKVDNMSQKEWEKAMKAVESEIYDSMSAEKKQQVKDNYIKALIEEGYSEELQELVKAIPVDQFIQTLDTDTEATFEFVYDQSELELRQIALFDTWEAAAEAAGIDLDDLYFEISAKQYTGE